MISAQNAFRVCREGKPLRTFPHHVFNENGAIEGWRRFSCSYAEAYFRLPIGM
jgi:hypothetical protein